MSDRILNEIRRYPVPVHGRRYGIEIEIENVAPPGLPLLRGWSQISDHSLRGMSAELITMPEAVESLHDRLRAVYELHRAGAWAPTVRCGIHIHANVRWARASELRAILQRYILAEPLLFLMMGPTREQSNFCVPWYRSVPAIKGAAQMLYQWEHFDKLAMDPRLSKYSALNLRPLESLGTIEFRHAPTFDTEERAHQWLDVVHAIMTGAPIPVDPDLAEIGRQRSLLLDTEALAAGLVRTREKVPAEAWGVPSSMRLSPLNFSRATPEMRAPRRARFEPEMQPEDVTEDLRAAADRLMAEGAIPRFVYDTPSGNWVMRDADTPAEVEVEEYDNDHEEQP